MSATAKILQSPNSDTKGAAVCTVVSLLPFPVNEYKPGLVPCTFHLDASTDGKPQLLYLGECMHYMYLDGDRGSLEVINPPHTIAESLVEDLKRAIPCTSPEASPAIWWIQGLLSVQDLLNTHKDDIEERLKSQDLWYKALIQESDDSWSRSRQHSMISDMARLACKSLGLAREWNIVVLEDVKPFENCPGCGTSHVVGIVICPSCNCILDQDGYDKLKFAR